MGLRSLFGLDTPEELKEVKHLKGKMMTAVLVQLMAEYVSQQQTLISMKENKSALTEYDRLTKLGLGNSKNARLLKERIDAVRITNDNYAKAQRLMQFVKQLRSEFGPSSFLISLEQFNGIVNKYKLSLRLLEEYTGVIPEENINEVERAIIAASQTKLSLNRWKELPPVAEGTTLNNYSSGTAFYVSSARDQRSGDYNPAYYQEPILSHASVIEAGKYTWRENESEADEAHECNDWFPECEYGILVKLIGKRLSKQDMLIAAPAKCFKENFRVEKAPVDPIVYQVCPYGIVVHSVWGEEADDAVLRQYKEFNENLFK